MTEPTDDEIMELAKPFIARVGSHWENDNAIPDNGRIEDFARAVLAKWGTPPAAAPWRSAVLDLIDECPGLTMEQDQWLSRRVKELDFASAQQPTQAQAGAVPPFTKDELNAAACDYSDKIAEQCDFRNGARWACDRFGIKGGQHGPA